MITSSIPPALRILSHFWLEEIQPDDLAMVRALPELAEALPQTSEGTLIDLAVEYQRLFGFNLPPYESVFVDPSAMLMAPATARVEALYRLADWRMPGVRVGAPDHLGLELLALADWLEGGLIGPARRLHTDHLALWAPALIASVRRLGPAPFYNVLAELTLELLLETLPAENGPAGDPFPVLPPAPVYSDRGPGPPDEAGEEETSPGLNLLVKQLLTPCEAGLYLTREDCNNIGQDLELPAIVGERERMLKSLFHLAGQYDMLSDLLNELIYLLDQTSATYGLWADDYPAWTPYANAWRKRLIGSRTLLNQIKV